MEEAKSEFLGPMEEAKGEFLGPSPKKCDYVKEHSLLPSHPATWHLEHAGSVLPQFAETHAEYSYPDGGLHVHWNSRSQRKGRAPVVRTADGKRLPLKKPPIVLLNLDVTNTSWWIGAMFTVASACFVAHGAYLFAPGLAPTELAKDIVVAVTGVIGGGLFVIGGYLAVLEALNAEPEVDLACLLESHGEADDSGWTGTAVPTRRQQSQASRKEAQPSWRWWGWEPRSEGYMASLLILIGSIIFFIPCITGIWVIFNSMSRVAQDLLFWLPTAVASCFFILSPALLMLEVQHKWYVIRPLNLGWQASFWNFLGGCAFLLCGVLGFVEGNENVYTWGVAFSILWGSTAFTIGSMIMWVESMNPHAIN